MLGAKISASSFDELLTRAPDAFDAVVVHGAVSERASLACRAAAAGKHVLVEMPFALSTQEADDVIGACRAAGVTLMVGQASRFMPAHRAVKEASASGKLGSPGLLRIHSWDAQGTSISNSTSMHREIDLALWLFEAQPESVFALQRSNPDYFQVHLGFSQGGMAIIDRAIVLPQDAQPYFSLSLIGSTGAAYADDHHNMHLLYAGGRPAALLADQGQMHLTLQLQEFVDAITQRREPAITALQGRQVIEVAEAVSQSIATGRAAHVVGGRYEF